MAAHLPGMEKRVGSNPIEGFMYIAGIGFSVKAVELRDCPKCNVQPGKCHEYGCDVERCSCCGQQRISCECADDECHDPCFARWTGFWPGEAEAFALGLIVKFEPGKGWTKCSPYEDGARPDLNTFATEGYDKFFFVKPEQ